MISKKSRESFIPRRERTTRQRVFHFTVILTMRGFPMSDFPNYICMRQIIYWQNSQTSSPMDFGSIPPYIPCSEFQLSVSQLTFWNKTQWNKQLILVLWPSEQFQIVPNAYKSTGKGFPFTSLETRELSRYTMKALKLSLPTLISKRWKVAPGIATSSGDLSGLICLLQLDPHKTKECLQICSCTV